MLRVNVYGQWPIPRSAISQCGLPQARHANFCDLAPRLDPADCIDTGIHHPYPFFRWRLHDAQAPRLIGKRANQGFNLTVETNG